MSTHDIWCLTGVVMLGYYIFFAIFMCLACLQHPLIMDNFGFMHHILAKSVFYAFLATLAFSETDFWSCDLTGAVFSVMVILNCLRYCCVYKKSGEAYEQVNIGDTPVSE